MAALADGCVVSAADDRTLRPRALRVGRGELLSILTLDAPVLAVAVGAEGAVIAGDSSGRAHFFDVVG